LKKEQVTVKFASVNQSEGFSIEIRKRVKDYFKSNNLSKKGDWRIYSKAIIWITLYIAPFVAMMVFNLNIWACLSLSVLMGIAAAAIGLNTMHDANHGTFSKRNWLNKLAGSTLMMLGGNPFTWRIQHNVLHHSFTNIHNHDEDISPSGVMRFSPEEKVKWIFKFQHIYGPFLYGLMSLVWTLHKDFVQIVKYRKLNLIKPNGSNFTKEMLVNILIKIGYFSYIIVLPLLIMDLAWWQWIFCFLTIHFVGGLLLALVFQAAHVVEETEHPQPKECGSMQDEWMIHQLKTTANFATNSKWFSWFCGGLNFQVEHHLFPNISHVHYPAMAKIVSMCAREYNVPYNDTPTFFQAVSSHFKELKALGKK
jgi:linoleoyl-CoA desaturase